MAYTLDFSLALGSGKAGLTDLRAQLVDTSGANVGAAISTGFTEIGTSGGNYLWHATAIPDAHRGGVKFYSLAAGAAAVLAFAAINPEEGERVDVAVSTRLAGAGYTAPLDAAGVRGAVGLAAANLDTQLGAIDDYLDTEVAAIYNRIGAPVGASIAADLVTIAAFVDTEVAAIKTATDTLAANYTAVRAAKLDNLDVTVGSRLATAGYTAPDNATVAAIATVAARLDTTLVADSPVYQFTANALELAPIATGSTDWTAPERTLILASLASILTKTNAIGGGGAVTIMSPVLPSGEIAPLVRGDDYLNADGRALDIPVRTPADLTGAAIEFAMIGAATVTKAGSVVTPTGDNQLIRVELTSTDTATAGDYRWEAEATLANGHKVTLRRGPLKILADRT